MKRRKNKLGAYAPVNHTYPYRLLGDILYEQGMTL